MEVESWLVHISIYLPVMLSVALRKCNSVALHINYALVPIYDVHHVLVLRQFSMLTVQAGDDNCVGRGYSDIKAHEIR